MTRLHLTQTEVEFLLHITNTSSGVAQAICAKLQKLVAETPSREAYIAVAKDVYYEEGIIEIDDDAAVSIVDPDEGVYVEAWVWVHADDVKNGEVQVLTVEGGTPKIATGSVLSSGDQGTVGFKDH